MPVYLLLLTFLDGDKNADYFFFLIFVAETDAVQCQRALSIVLSS